MNKFLLPLAWLYGLVVWLRNKLFDRNILPVEVFSVPLISIGNIRVGGTGKTPHTEYLIRLLSKKYKIAVLSRGYKRQTSGFIRADENANSRSIGDEPLQMYRKFPGITVAVDSNRRRGIKNLLKLPKDERPDVVLLDDAFQHRYVKPSLSLLLTSSKQPLYDDCLLPVGRLREPATNHVRADIVVCTKCLYPFDPIELQSVEANLHLLPHQQLFFSAYGYRSLLPVFPGNNLVRKESLERLKKEGFSFLLLTGFAHPEDMIAYLENYTSDLHLRIYPDHHAFRRKNINEITGAFQSIGNDRKIIVTSEKDAVRLTDNPYFPDELKSFIYYLPIEVIINKEELFTQKIENHVANFKRNRILA
ncbi:MAG: tetraacyldisaccharide 4'-kinase [Dysgonamonadaceae bacterium]|jgi:tetraacyldisaccharide 4'-kinase|nr:tetraacyldisaccharide 4'-kinase [Dysgonamonadaceae bacterium]